MTKEEYQEAIKNSKAYKKLQETIKRTEKYLEEEKRKDKERRIKEHIKEITEAEESRECFKLIAPIWLLLCLFGLIMNIICSLA